MILEVAILNIKKGLSEEFETSFEKAKTIISSMEGYVNHQLKKCIEKEDQYLLLVNQKDSSMALPRGFRFTSPLERSEFPFLEILGEVKQKISVFALKGKMTSIAIGGAKYLYGSASRIVDFKKFFIWQTIEDHEIGFRKSSKYQEWKKLLHHFYEPFPIVEHYK